MIEREISSVEDWIAEDMAEYAPEPDRSPRTFGELDAPKEQQDRMRSIFDDVDQ
jgi:hypothetical protein